VGMPGFKAPSGCSHSTDWFLVSVATRGAAARATAAMPRDFAAQRSGLLGLSGISGDMRELEDDKSPRAVAGAARFVYAMTTSAGAYASVVGGLDAFVFTSPVSARTLPGAHGALPQTVMARRETGRAVECCQ
jgi:hypothetical protein